MQNIYLKSMGARIKYKLELAQFSKRSLHVRFLGAILTSNQKQKGRTDAPVIFHHLLPKKMENLGHKVAER